MLIQIGAGLRYSTNCGTWQCVTQSRNKTTNIAATLDIMDQDNWDRAEGKAMHHAGNVIRTRAVMLPHVVLNINVLTADLTPTVY